MGQSATGLIGEQEGSPPAAEEAAARVALAGRNGWLFAVEAEEITRRGDRKPAEATFLEPLAGALEETARALHELQVRHVVAVVPTKLTVHRAFVPRLATKVGRRHGAALARLARDRQHLDVLDLLPALRDATAHGPLFHARDEAMNARGAFFAQRALLKQAGLGGLLPLPLERAVFAPRPDPPPRGLETLPVVQYKRGELLPCDLPPAGDDEGAEDVADAAALKALRMPASTHLEVAGLPAPRVYENAEAAGAPRVLLLGHPVIDALTPWIAEASSRVVVLSTPAAPLEQIELELPHVVIQVLEERFLAPT